MTEKLYRAQILLEPKQHYELREIAQREHRSISEVAREIIAGGLADRKDGRERRLAALERLQELRRDIEAHHGVYIGDPLAEARAARERQLDRAVFGDES